MTAVLSLTPDDAPEAADVLGDAFRDYPVMRFVLGPDPDYDDRLRTLVRFFVAARVLRQEPMLGLREPGGALIAAALVTLPGDRPAPAELLARREVLWKELGAAERKRYEAYGDIAGRFDVKARHHHLNMIGVRRTHAGRGLGRQLIEAVHELARSDADSSGVSLSTETRSNIELYEHLGYRLLGHARVSESLETWAFFRETERTRAR